MGKMGYSSIVIFMVFGLLLGSAYAQLKMGFYAQSFPKAEKIIQDYGCDASVLLNSTSNNQAEKDAQPNLTLRGFDFIDKVKSLVEAECPGVVSCADIISLAARDFSCCHSKKLMESQHGKFQLGDGRISVRSEALINIPNPNSNFATLRSNFAIKGLNVKDLILLSGAHIIGVSHCNPSFSNRLYNFSGRGGQDPSARKCRTITDNTTISEMDPGSFKTFDLGYYKNLVKRRGLFHSDAALLIYTTSKSFVTQLLQGSLPNFFAEFATSMEKMGQIGVMTGSTGDIRKKCSIVN
ncbi:hypothetical protein MKX03_004005 [Papaver bracteatum]|nr:hypothetical protein MKX03_004005 [Papaver bracteatum]